MKPTGQNKRPKDWLPFVNFAMLRGVPSHVKLQEHLFPYVGVQPSDQFIWGVYGTTSINAAIFSASSYAIEATAAAPGEPDVRSLQLTTWFRIDDFNSIPSQQSAEDVRKGGYLHLGRVNSVLREELRKQWVDWVREARPNEAATIGASLETMHLEALAERFPQYVRVLLSEDPDLHVVIHPVQQTYQKSRIPIWVLTARYDRSRLMAAEARFAPMVAVEI